MGKFCKNSDLMKIKIKSSRRIKLSGKSDMENFILIFYLIEDDRKLF